MNVFNVTNELRQGGEVEATATELARIQKEDGHCAEYEIALLRKGEPRRKMGCGVERYMMKVGQRDNEMRQ